MGCSHVEPAAGSKQPAARCQEPADVGYVLEDLDDADHVETGLGESKFVQFAAPDIESSCPNRLGRGFGHLRTDHVPVPVPGRFHQRAGAAADIQPTIQSSISSEAGDHLVEPPVNEGGNLQVSFVVVARVVRRLRGARQLRGEQRFAAPAGPHAKPAHLAAAVAIDAATARARPSLGWRHGRLIAR